VGVAPHVAKFHLDRLARDGLLEVDYQRPPGRSGPGAGRPPKVFRRSARDVEVSVPERRYDLAARLLARAVERSQRDGLAIGDALHEVAWETGRACGAMARDDAGPRPTNAAVRAALCRTLDDWGFEARAARGAIELANCPFHALAQEHTELVCGMNQSLLEGVLDGAGLSSWTARLEPSPSRCCVRIATS
jgi:predicted ArsR family transcriptional regulator